MNIHLAVQYAAERIENLGDNPEYERGVINILADLFAVPGMDTGTRMEQIEGFIRRTIDESRNPSAYEARSRGLTAL